MELLKIKNLLWLDDYRNPFDKKMDWLVFSPIGRNVKTIWVKSYQEFDDYITINGLPDGICFDHDLADEHYSMDMFKGDSYNFLYETFNEKTGYDCAKWLVEYCMDNNKEIPSYNIQSANPVGKENIDKLLKSFISFYLNEKSKHKEDKQE